MKMREFIDGLNLKDGDRHRGDCPECRGRNTFTVTNMLGDIKYNCFKLGLYCWWYLWFRYDSSRDTVSFERTTDATCIHKHKEREGVDGNTTVHSVTQGTAHETPTLCKTMGIGNS